MQLYWASQNKFTGTIMHESTSKSVGTCAIEVNHVSKFYGATRAVDDVTFQIQRGSAHVLLGENGAGKSTLVKLLSGLIAPSEGGFKLGGQEVSLSGPRAAHQSGIQTAFQEMIHVRNLTVLDNMLLPYGPVNALGMLKRKDAKRQIETELSSLGIRD